MKTGKNSLLCRPNSYLLPAKALSQEQTNKQVSLTQFYGQCYRLYVRMTLTRFVEVDRRHLRISELKVRFPSGREGKAIDISQLFKSRNYNIALYVDFCYTRYRSERFILCANKFDFSESFELHCRGSPVDFLWACAPSLFLSF